MTDEEDEIHVSKDQYHKWWLDANEGQAKAINLIKDLQKVIVSQAIEINKLKEDNESI